MNFIQKFIFLHVVAVFIVNLAAAPTFSGAVGRGDANEILETPLKNKEAAVWYLFHCGWAVKTSSALLIFDHLAEAGQPEHFSFSKGVVNPGEIKDQNVFVFISHRHGDHFDKNILEWKKAIPNITYIFGGKAPEAQGHHTFGEERISLSVGPLKVRNIFHDFDNIPESAFLIEVDGLTIYFSGDHGNSPGALNPVYKDNIDYISQQSDEFDLAFLSIFGSPTYEGELYAIDKFRPRLMLPMHYWGREAEGFVALARSKFPKTEFWYPSQKGDRFLYKEGKIFPLK